MITHGANLLTAKILGGEDVDIVQTLRQIAISNSLKHIAHLRFVPKQSSDLSLLTATVTYPVEWQHRYFEKQHVLIDPVVTHGIGSRCPFDWAALLTEDPNVLEFFADAARYDLGRNGFSIPIRAGDGSVSIVSFTSDLQSPEWEAFTRANLAELQMISILVDAAASSGQKLPAPRTLLSQREEQCLVWAARGKTYEDISGILGVSYASVKRYLDTARHKLNCINLTHAVAVAIATGVIPPMSVR